MITLRHVISALALALTLLMMHGCSSVELAIDLYKKQKRDSAEITVVAEPRYKVGNPYKVGGVWYYPKRDLTYDDTGIGSWYGVNSPETHNNGEIFDPELVTAAHKTLLLQRWRVTNLENGKSLVLQSTTGPICCWSDH